MVDTKQRRFKLKSNETNITAKTKKEIVNDDIKSTIDTLNRVGNFIGSKQASKHETSSKRNNTKENFATGKRSIKHHSSKVNNHTRELPSKVTGKYMKVDTITANKFIHIKSTLDELKDWPQSKQTFSEEVLEKARTYTRAEDCDLFRFFESQSKKRSIFELDQKSNSFLNDTPTFIINTKHPEKIWKPKDDPTDAISLVAKDLEKCLLNFRPTFIDAVHKANTPPEKHNVTRRKLGRESAQLLQVKSSSIETLINSTEQEQNTLVCLDEPHDYAREEELDQPKKRQKEDNSDGEWAPNKPEKSQRKRESKKEHKRYYYEDDDFSEDLKPSSSESIASNQQRTARASKRNQSASDVSCPLCFNHFLPSEIESHASRCIS